MCFGQSDPRLIVTLPLGVLQLPPSDPGHVRFEPDIERTRHAAAQLVSGPVVKAVLRFDRAFWEEEGVANTAHADEGLKDASFLHDTAAPFPTWWTLRPLRLPVLTGWAGGPNASALVGMSRKDLVGAAVASLAQVFGQREKSIHARLVRAHTYDWASDPYARGAYSYVGVGGLRARGLLARPVEKTLYFAGEATDTAGQASTVAGALASGSRAAREVLDAD